MTLLKGPDVENVTEQILSNVVRPGLRRLILMDFRGREGIFSFLLSRPSDHPRGIRGDEEGRIKRSRKG